MAAPSDAGRRKLERLELGEPDHDGDEEEDEQAHDDRDVVVEEALQLVGWLAALLRLQRLDLDADWLNDGAKAFVPGDDPDQSNVFEGEYLQVAAASPRFLLAMKLLAARVERDQEDIRALYRLCGFTTAEEGLRVVATAYPSRIIPPRTRFMLEEMFPAVERGKDREGPDLGTGL